MTTKIKLTLIWILSTILTIIVFIQLVSISDRQKYLNKLKAQESLLDEIMTEQLINLNEINTDEYQILQARKHGFGFKNDKRFEES